MVSVCRMRLTRTLAVTPPTARISLLDDLRQTPRELCAPKPEESVIDQLGFQLSHRRSPSSPPDDLADAFEASDSSEAEDEGG